MREDSSTRKGRKVSKRKTPVSMKGVESTNLQIEPHEQASKDQLLGRILEAADDAIISVDHSQCIILFNKGAEKIFGWTSREVMGQSLDVLLPKDKTRVHRQYIREFGESGTEARKMAERGEIAGRRKNGENFPAEASISQVDGGGSKIVVRV